MREEVSCATRFPSHVWDTVIRLCKLMAQACFMPSSNPSKTSEGTPRIVEVMGATVTLVR